jgi:CNT family concentrative nucleoside transporter
VGLGLQILFGIIVLRDNIWSFLGMGALGLLIVNYMLKDEFPPLPRWQKIGVISSGSVGVGLLLIWIGQGLGYLLGISLLALFALYYLRQYRLFRFTGVLFLVTGVALLVVRDVHGQFIFQTVSNKVAYFLSLSDYGAQFLFGNLAKEKFFEPQSDQYWPGFGFQFAFKVLPTIVFFGGFMSILYYLGLIQKMVQALSRFMRWLMGTSGAETLSVSANIFVGQTESPLLIRPFLNDMTRSELLTIMVGGFATIAGGVLAGYIAMGIPAGHLIAASVMSAPAALVIGKIIYPELEESQTAGEVEMPDIKSGSNVIESATNGIMDGLRLAVNVGAMLLGFIALIAVADLALNWLDSLVDGKWLGGTYVEYAAGGMSPATGEYKGYFPGSLQTLFGTLLRPLAWLMGVPWQDANSVGNLLGIKLTLNEFVAYGKLGEYIHQDTIGEQAQIIATYALCGFANFSSIGIQLGGLSALAPNRKTVLAKVSLWAMFGGALASWLTATIAGVLV